MIFKDWSFKKTIIILFVIVVIVVAVYLSFSSPYILNTFAGQSLYEDLREDKDGKYFYIDVDSTEWQFMILSNTVQEGINLEKDSFGLKVYVLEQEGTTSMDIFLTQMNVYDALLELKIIDAYKYERRSEIQHNLREKF